MDNNLISIIIPVYNVEKYLEECVESVVKQTYKNLEIILVDDGSTDNSGKICDNYAVKDKRIKVIHKENGGQSDARNAGLDICTGDFIGFIDSDDYVEADMFETLIKNIYENDADIVSCRWFTEYVNNKIKDGIGQRYILNNDDIIIRGFGENLLSCGVWDKLFKKDVFESMRFPKGKIFEDTYINIKIFLNVSKVVIIPDALYHYRQRKSSVSHDVDYKQLNDQIEAYEEQQKDIVKFGKCNKCLNRAEAMLLNVKRTAVYNMLINNDNKIEKLDLNCFLQEICSKRKDIIKNKYLTKVDKISFLILGLNKNIFKNMILFQ